MVYTLPGSFNKKKRCVVCTMMSVLALKRLNGFNVSILQYGYIFILSLDLKQYL